MKSTATKAPLNEIDWNTPHEKAYNNFTQVVQAIDTDLT